MARQAKLGHFLDDKGPADRLTAVGYPWTAIAENVAISNEEDPKNVLDQWLNSPHHRRNLLNDKVSEIGVGMSRSPSGKVYSTAVFASR
jgi:uncharacterized protein YkwD